ncbi:DNA-formamidopyrimidine glycosylase family protein [Gordonia sp. (in: high G+C Gram-positive bacteria)]|uniref:DNA-formamidopyrimidine glycosylase family protein n=1 Tax=Gordonia sp. (in: high G+C Gram-positive bacteria) TaxID=84139 RepID=UPI00169C183A|nr:DNA-formamidopyrimidine glycosylase family protein [Gordonia sp. (in: high G+C Gram-positive bacteria)]NLG47815.1 Fpg/Nei family DNA glycosylase [Gordonia sp. (in: high G+C Gram-positive bacteria)]
MPEGDTVFHIAHRLRAALEGKTLTRSDFRVPKEATVDLSGTVVTGVRSVGKHLFIDVVRADPAGSDHRPLSIHSHLKMEGAWHVHATGARWRRPAHTARVVLRSREVEAVGFDLGVLEVLTDPSAAVAHLGPDLLGPEWDPDVAVANLAADPSLPIGLALLDQRKLAGIGNVYRSELCFLRRVHPATPAGRVDLPAMVDLAHRLLYDNRLRTVRSTTGVRARGRELWVYGRARRSCRRCGTAVERLSLGAPPDDRNAYLCPRCQPRH